MMEQWLAQLMNPQNSEALVGQLATRGAPPPELLESIGRQGPPQMSQVPGAPGSFSEMLQQAGAPGTVQPAPQMSQVPGMAQGPQPVPMAAPPEQPPGPRLTMEQIQQLQQSQQQPRMQAPGAPGLMSGSRVGDPQMLQVSGPGARQSLAKLLYGR